jgi:hypothetical protein
MRLLVYFCSVGFLYVPHVAAEQWIVPGATNASAANGLHYATDLKLCNQGSVTASVTLDLITAADDVAVGSAPQSIAPGQTLVLTNVLQAIWGLTERSGALRVTADQQIVIAANVYTDADDQGSYGFELDAIPYERWTTAGATVHSALHRQSIAQRQHRGAREQYHGIHDHRDRCMRHGVASGRRGGGRGCNHFNLAIVRHAWTDRHAET